MQDSLIGFHETRGVREEASTMTINKEHACSCIMLVWPLEPRDSGDAVILQAGYFQVNLQM